MSQTSTSGTAPLFPPGRYGRRRESAHRRWPVVIALAMVIGITSLIAVKLYRQYGTEQLSPTVLSYRNVTASSITVTFTVHKTDTAIATCTVDALAVDGSQVGTAEVPVPAGTDVIVTYTVPTSTRAYLARVPSCRTTR